jgi:lipopolysaccharide transport system ATP-binding protein
MPELAAKFDGVWKSYPRWRPGSRSLRSMLSRRLRTISRSQETRWALQDVSFDVRDGEAVGLIGQNGAGKSTLLRLASGLGRITRGSILVSPDVASVLSLGASLSADLTGRENALTATLLAGTRMAEAERRVDDAIEFAELEEFAHSPVRSYSDGMRLRLSFGVVAQLRPDLLLLDEVIAVGDLQFREKCMERIEDRQADGMGLLFASHDLEQVEDQCSRAIWLDNGRIRARGDAEQVVGEYRDAMRTETFSRTPEPGEGADQELELRTNRFGSQEVTINDVSVMGSSDGEATTEVDETFSIDFTLRREGSPLPPPVISVAIFRAEDDVLCCQSSTDSDDIVVGEIRGEKRVAFRWDSMELLPGEYVIDVGVYKADWEYAYDFHWHAYRLRVVGENNARAVFRQQGRRWRVGD